MRVSSLPRDTTDSLLREIHLYNFTGDEVLDVLDSSGKIVHRVVGVGSRVRIPLGVISALSLREKEIGIFHTQSWPYPSDRDLFSFKNLQREIGTRSLLSMLIGFSWYGHDIIWSAEPLSTSSWEDFWRKYYYETDRDLSVIDEFFAVTWMIWHGPTKTYMFGETLSNLDEKLDEIQGR